MNRAGKILSVAPKAAISGGEIEIAVDGFLRESAGSAGCFADGRKCNIVAASRRRILAELPEQREPGVAALYLEAGTHSSNIDRSLIVGGVLAENMHMVANPAIDPKDDSIILTRSGSRGQQLPNTLFRLEADGYVDTLPVDVMNPTGIAFGLDGDLFVTNRAEGIVYRIDRGEEAVPIARGLGIATGIAINADGVMFVGDRAGTIYRILSDGSSDEFARLEPSVAAYHMAFGVDGELFVTAPGLASFDGIHSVGKDGTVRPFFRGLGRPQGLAVSDDGWVYVAASYQGKRGVFRIDPGGSKAEHIIAGSGIVGLCFNRNGDAIVATGTTIYLVALGVKSLLLS
jgi:DNA-binding beta-propeller fold protein YncE